MSTTSLGGGALAVEDSAADLLPHSKRTNAMNWLYLGWVVSVVMAAILAPMILGGQATEQELGNRLQPPSSEHLLGTDGLGRDILSRILVGARPTMLIAVGGVLVGLFFGTLVGTLAGFLGGVVNRLAMAVVDIMLSFPTILFAIGIIAVFGSGTINLIIVMGLASWVNYARVQRSAVLRVKAESYVEACRMLGCSTLRLMWRHVLPNTFSPLLVVGTIELSRMILLESTLSFLGLGVQPPMASWGGMVGDGRGYLSSAWWLAVFGGIAITLTALSISRLGDWLRDVLDPVV